VEKLQAGGGGTSSLDPATIRRLSGSSNGYVDGFSVFGKPNPGSTYSEFPPAGAGGSVDVLKGELVTARVDLALSATATGAFDYAKCTLAWDGTSRNAMTKVVPMVEGRVDTTFTIIERAASDGTRGVQLTCTPAPGNVAKVRDAAWDARIPASAAGTATLVLESRAMTTSNVLP
jgi:hypothetical protein